MQQITVGSLENQDGFDNPGKTLPDFETGDEFLDSPPKEAHALLEISGIDPNYYLSVPDEPTTSRMIVARQTLARLLDLPVPDEDGLYQALDDEYHGLTIGPCSPDEIAAWSDNPWIQVIGMSDPDWDCDYKTWVAAFGQAVPKSPFQLVPGIDEIVIEMPSKLSVESCGNSWVIRNDVGSYWCGLVDNCWTDALNDEDMPTLRFPTEAEARTAYGQANRMYSDRVKRHEQAMAWLRSANE